MIYQTYSILTYLLLNWSTRMKLCKKLNTTIRLRLIIQIVLPALIIVASSGCQKITKNDTMEELETQIINTEKAFNEMVLKEGMDKAFEHFAAENAVILRGNQLIKGKKEIKAWQAMNTIPFESFSWSPDVVEVSKSGDMAYTYGSYTITVLDSVVKKKEIKGIFHTVWKRQDDGSWKYVWD